MLWVIGGEQIYRQTAAFWDELYLTLVSGCHSGDAYFPEFEGAFELMEEEPRLGFRVMENIARLLARRIRETNLKLRNTIANLLY